MPTLTFKDLCFEPRDDVVRVNFLKVFFFDLDIDDLGVIAPFSVDKHSISFDGISDHKASNKFNFLLAKGFENLTNKLTKKRTVYVHQFSGIPLLGSNVFGLIDRDTSIIEVRVLTGCNINCLYCSVTQDKRMVDFVVEKDYLVSEFKKLVVHKQMDDLEAHIGTQGEPLLYQPLVDLVQDLSDIRQVSIVALDTNGTLLSESLVDELVSAGLTRFCFSINALDQVLASKIAGVSYNLPHILSILDYISNKDVQLILTPVWIPGVNDSEIPKVIELSKKLGADIGIQNFLNYKHGKNPVQAMDWDTFIDKMKVLESVHDVKLLLDFKKDFNIRQSTPLPKPFRKGDVVKARIVAVGRLPGEMLAVASNRVITITTDRLVHSMVRCRITRSKHNVFYAISL